MPKKEASLVLETWLRDHGFKLVNHGDNDEFVYEEADATEAPQGDGRGRDSNSSTNNSNHSDTSNTIASSPTPSADTLVNQK